MRNLDSLRPNQASVLLSSEVAVAEAELEGSVAVVKGTAACVVGVTISDISDSHSKSQGTSTEPFRI